MWEGDVGGFIFVIAIVAGIAVVFGTSIRHLAGKLETACGRKVFFVANCALSLAITFAGIIVFEHTMLFWSWFVIFVGLGMMFGAFVVMIRYREK